MSTTTQQSTDFISNEMIQLVTGFKNLVDTIEKPSDELLNIESAQRLHQQAITLQKSESTFYRGSKVLLDFLLSLKAKPEQAINKKLMESDGWKSIPADLKPSIGNTYAGLYEVKKIFLPSLEFYENNLPGLRRINSDLAKVEYELRVIVDGHQDKAEFAFASDAWKAVKVVPKYVPPTLTKRWGDMESSSDDEEIIKVLDSLAKVKEDKKPSIKLPGDFKECFPMLDRRLNRFCTLYEWEVEYDREAKLRNQGLILFSEKEDGTIDSTKLDDQSRVALASLYACIGSLSIQPQSLVAKESTEVAVTYVCSVIAQERLSENNKELLQIALKNGDGGKTVLRGRFYSLTKTGSSAIRLVIDAVEKVIGKFARELDEKFLDKETVEEISKRSFTSIEGMMENCYRTSLVDATVTVDKADRRGKAVKVVEKIRKKHKVLPDISISGVPLKTTEISKLNGLKKDFNDRKAIIEKRLLDFKEPTLLTRPTVCRDVVLEAYDKISGLKAILRDRVIQIRQEAMKLNDGKKPGPGHWATAKASVLEKCPDIAQAVFDSLKW